MNKIKVSNGEHTVINLNNLVTIDKLDDNKVYLLNFNPDFGYYYLTETNPLELPSKVYGDKSHLNKYLKKYQMQNRNLGVLLSGIKGDGKSVDAKMLAIMAKQPIIIINSGYRDQTFLEFVTDPVFNNVTFLIDEFEKVYYSDNIEISTVNILKLLDGYSNNKNLFILTSNELNVSKYLINRPSRIRYIKNYTGLSKELIIEIVTDKLINKSILESTIETILEYPLITTDVLLEIINDINDLDISAEDAILDLNFNSDKFKISLKSEITSGKQTCRNNLGCKPYSKFISEFESGEMGMWCTFDIFKKDDNEDRERYISLPIDKNFIDTIKEAISNKYFTSISIPFIFEGHELIYNLYGGDVPIIHYTKEF